MRQAKGTTAHLVRHLRVNHKAVYNSRLKGQLESPDFPETFDASHPIWQFYTVADVKSAHCNDCLDLIPIFETSLVAAVDHLIAHHKENHDSYLELVAGGAFSSTGIRVFCCQTFPNHTSSDVIQCLRKSEPPFPIILATGNSV
jgi:hypothetical protein